MDNCCRECGDDTLQTQFLATGLVLVCSSCGAVLDRDTDEIEIEILQDEDDYFEGDEDDGTSNDSHAVETDIGDRQVPSDKGSSKVIQTAPLREVQTETVLPVLSCKSCNGNTLVYETINDTEQLVCEDCGYFIEETELVSTQEYTPIAGSSTAYQWARAPKPKFANDAPYIAKGKAESVEVIKDISARLSLRQELTDQAVKMFEDIYPDKKFKGMSNDLKATLGVCCVYSVAKENGVKLTLKTIMRLHAAKTKLFTKALRLIKAISDKPVPYQKISTLPEHILASGRFPSAFLDKTSKLMHVCEKGFVTQGRDIENVIIGVAHLVWISEDIGKRKSVTLKQFCSDHNLPYTIDCRRLQTIIRQLLATLTSHLPYLTEPIRVSKVIYYLNDIIKYGQTAISRASRKDQVSLPQDECRLTAVSIGCQAQLEALPVLGPPSMKLKRRIATDTDQFKLPADLKVSDLDREDVHDSEFSDHEISSYLLTSEEVEVKQDMLKAEKKDK
ncbi:transcription factor IIIB 50 kDa subunit-like [Littorina saxatilis]|uniref:BRF2-like C-terminal domain-containing protein n=1 Tax=Littorina saxatilis TaxID=31220 RepID=A0AAN9GI81_9CAEN